MEWARRIAARAPAIIAAFKDSGDGDSLQDANKLLEATFFAFRLVVELTTRKGATRFLLLVGLVPDSPPPLSPTACRMHPLVLCPCTIMLALVVVSEATAGVPCLRFLLGGWPHNP